MERAPRLVVVPDPPAPGDHTRTGDLQRAELEPVRSEADLSSLLAKPPLCAGWRFVDILTERMGVDPDVVRALHREAGSGVKLGELLVEQGYCDPVTIQLALAMRFQVPAVDIDSFPFDQEVLDLIEEPHARRHLMIPLAWVDGRLAVASATAVDHDAEHFARLASGRRPHMLYAPEPMIRRAIERHYTSFEEGVALRDFGQAVDRMGLGPDDRAKLTRTEHRLVSPVVRMLDLMLERAISLGASDLNFRPDRNRIHVYMRVDGGLQHRRTLPLDMLGTLVNRIKVVAGLSGAPTGHPADGRSVYDYQGRRVDLRVSIVPTVHGENVVIRVLDRHRGLLTLDRLGLPTTDVVGLRRVLRSTGGLVLVAGPTGHGKTTTCYSMIEHLRNHDLHIVTIEDPVENAVDGLTQIELKQSQGMGFADTLRHVLRHDPDIILVGEIRDQETARIAVEAATTGHLVLSTVHADSAVSVASRLLDLGVDPTRLASALIAVLAQRLVRKNCPHCRTLEPIEASLAADFSLDQSERFLIGRGCARCGWTGYEGRVPVAELMEVTPRIRQMVHSNRSTSDLQTRAISEGMNTMAAQAMELARSGEVALSEVAGTILRESLYT